MSEPRRFDGLVWRYVPAWSYPLHVRFVLHAAGRWNRYDEYGCLYTALSQAGAAAEYDKVLPLVGLAAADDDRKDIVSIRVTVQRVLDLTDCRSVADLARADGYRAILSPSAALSGGRNLSIYLEGRAADLQLHDGPDRAPLNY